MRFIRPSTPSKDAMPCSICSLVSFNFCPTRTAAREFATLNSPGILVVIFISPNEYFTPFMANFMDFGRFSPFFIPYVI